MTNEAKKEYLENYRLQQAKILRFNEMMATDPDSRDSYLKEVKKAKKLRRKIEADIKKVDDGILSEILSQKYICGKNLEEISFVLHYSRRQIERLHLKALEKFLS